MIKYVCIILWNWVKLIFWVFLLCFFPDKKAYWITSMFGCLVPISSLQLSELLADRILMLLYRKTVDFKSLHKHVNIILTKYLTWNKRNEFSVYIKRYLLYIFRWLYNMEIQEPDQHTEQLLIIKAHRSYRAKHSKRKKLGVSPEWDFCDI